MQKGYMYVETYKRAKTHLIDLIYWNNQYVYTTLIFEDPFKLLE